MTRWWFQRFVSFSPLFGEDFQFDEHIFQMGWFNHQLDENVRKHGEFFFANSRCKRSGLLHLTKV